MKCLCPKCNDPMLAACPTCGWSESIKQGLRAPKLPPIAPKMRYVSIDIETTGLDPETCQVLEIGAVIDDWQMPIDQLQQFRRVLIHKTVSGDPYAMALNANLWKQIAMQLTAPYTTHEFCKPEEVCEQFAQWLTVNQIDPKHIQAAGKNFATFDMLFLRRLPHFRDHLNFRHRVLDPALFYWRPSEDEQLPNTSTCYERAGINTSVAHTAIEDALAVVRLVRLGIRCLEGTRA